MSTTPSNAPRDVVPVMVTRDRARADTTKLIGSPGQARQPVRLQRLSLQHYLASGLPDEMVLP